MAQMRAIVDKLLTNVSSQFIPKGYISELLLPYVGVEQSTGKPGKYGLSHLRIETSYTGGRGKYRRVEPTTRSTTSYEIEGHGLEGLVSADDYRNVELPFDAEKDETEGLTATLWVEKEYSLASTLADTGVVTQNTTLSGTSQFNDKDNSNPIGVFETARAAVRTGCGMAPDTAWMSWAVKNKLKAHPQLLDLLGYKYARPGGLNDEELASALDVKRVLIADVSYNSAKEGQADVLADVWGKHMWFGVMPENPALRQVSAGYRFGYKNQSARKVYKESVFNPPGSMKILVQDEYDFVISNVGAIYLVKDAIA
jgi:hypothetical protein